MSVGDLTSDARGSGARANTGKPDLSLVPLRILVNAYRRRRGLSFAQRRALLALECLAYWQEREPGAWLLRAWGALGPEAIAECAHVFDYGRRKYKAWNWSKGMAWSVPLACAARHCLAILDGQHLDTESGRPHFGHVACNLAMLMTFERSFPEGDDRAAAGRLAA